MRIALTGATGFLGRHVLSELEARGLSARVLVRPRGDRAAPAGPRVEVVPGDLLDPEGLAALVEGAEVVLHSAAVLGTDAERMERVNAGGTRALLAAAERAGAARFVYVSSIAASARPEAPYGGSKLRGEEAVRASRLPWVVLRPPSLLGPGSQVDARVRGFGRVGVVPTLRGGRVFPLRVEDAARACVEACLREGVEGGTYELPGPEALTLDDIVRRTLREQGRRALVLPVPAGLAHLGARLLVRTLGRSPISPEAVDAVVRGTPMDGSAASRDLDFRPRPVG